jgi:hypothetical protein
LEEFIDRVFGFLPQRTTVFIAVGLFIVIQIIQLLFKFLDEKLALPWMKEENQKQRKEVYLNNSNEKKG